MRSVRFLSGFINAIICFIGKHEPVTSSTTQIQIQISVNTINADIDISTSPFSYNYK